MAILGNKISRLFDWLDQGSVCLRTMKIKRQTLTSNLNLNLSQADLMPYHIGFFLGESGLF